MINPKVDCNENYIDSISSYNVNNISFFQKIKYKFSSLKGHWSCNPPLDSNSILTTGIVSRSPESNAVRITLLNQSKSTKYISISAYNWNNEFEEYFYCSKVYLPPYSGSVVDILLKSSSYDDSYNFELYEVRLSPYSDKIKVNTFEINTKDVAQNG